MTDLIHPFPITTIGDDQYLSANDAARLMNITNRYVRIKIQRGEIRWVKLDKYYVRLADAVNFQKSIKSEGRKKRFKERWKKRLKILDREIRQKEREEKCRMKEQRSKT